MDSGVEDIDLNDPDVQKAATKIQASFRGHKLRRELDMKEGTKPINNEIADIDLTDPELADAALKIQAGFRVHKAKKEAKKKDVEEETSRRMKQLDTDFEDLTFDLRDPDLNKAAIKIQATFRGHKTRRDFTN